MNRILLMMLCSCSPMIYDNGVPNLATVNANVIRSGQITITEGWDTIEKIAAGRHVHVIKLNYNDEGSDKLALDRGWDVHELAIQPKGDTDIIEDVVNVFTRPDDKIVSRVEQLLESADNNNLWLVHCTHGQDRTGYIVGRYRVLHEGWTKEKAYKEMLSHNFHALLHGIHEAWEDFKPR